VRDREREEKKKRQGREQGERKSSETGKRKRNKRDEWSGAKLEQIHSCT
jgi:hypothetical protein